MRPTEAEVIHLLATVMRQFKDAYIKKDAKEGEKNEKDPAHANAPA